MISFDLLKASVINPETSEVWEKRINVPLQIEISSTANVKTVNITSVFAFVMCCSDTCDDSVPLSRVLIDAMAVIRKQTQLPTALILPPAFDSLGKCNRKSK